MRLPLHRTLLTVIAYTVIASCIASHCIAQQRLEPVVQTGHTSLGINDVAFSRDAKHLATAGVDGVVVLWNTLTGEIVRSFSDGNVIMNSINSVCFASDGKHLVTSSSQKATLWEIETGKPLRIFAEDQSRIERVRMSDDGAYLVSCHSGKQDKAILWDLKTGKQIRAFSEGPINNPNDKEPEKPSSNATPRESYEIADACLTPDARFLVTATSRNAIVWNAATGERVRTLPGPGSAISTLHIDRQGKLLAAGSYEGAMLWELATGKTIHLFEKGNDVQKVQFSADSKFLATATLDHDNQRKTAGDITLWDIASGEKVRKFVGHQRAASIHDEIICDISPDGKQLVSASWDGSAILWDLRTGEMLRKYTAKNLDKSSFLSASSGDNGRAISSLSNQSNSIFYNKSDGAKVKIALETGEFLVTHQSDTCTVKVQDDQLIVSHPRLGIKQFKRSNPAMTLREVRVVALSKDGTAIACDLKDGNVVLWDFVTARPLHEIPTQQRRMSSISFSGNGKYLLTTAKDKTAFLWNVETGKQLFDLSTEGQFTYLASFLSDQKHVRTYALA